MSSRQFGALTTAFKCVCNFLQKHSNVCRIGMNLTTLKRVFIFLPQNLFFAFLFINFVGVKQKQLSLHLHNLIIPHLNDILS